MQQRCGKAQQRDHERDCNRQNEIHAEQGADEQRSDHQRDEQRGQHGQRNRTIDERGPARQHAQARVQVTRDLGSRRVQPILHDARAIDDPTDAAGEHVQRGSDTREQEDRRDRCLNDLSNAGHL